MQGMYIKEELCVFISESRFIIYKCIKMNGVYVNEKLCFYINASRCMVCM